MQPPQKLIVIEGCNATGQIKIGDTVVIKKAGRPGTGYGWHLINSSTYEKGILYLGKSREEKVSNFDDEPGTSYFRFVVFKAGEYTINLEYKRSGENQVPAETCSINLSIQK